MKNDIIPPRKSVQPDVATPAAFEPSTSSINGPGLPEIAPLETVPAPSNKPETPLKWILTGMVISIFGLILAMLLWYLSALAPVDSSDESRQRINIESGSSMAAIGTMLEEEGLIRNRLAFNLYSRFIDASARLQAGEYSLSPSESAQEIMDHLISGRVDQFSITFLPGATLRRLPGETDPKYTDIKSALLDVGYEEDEIEAAFKAEYDHPLLVSRPATADLEGYVFGETYTFASSSSVKQILEATFDQYYQVVEENNLVEGFKAQGLTLHEGIILASIIQREVSGSADQRQVAQVFLDRLKIGMPLGADATFEYGAKKEGISPSPTIDSPYNTRRFTGLPPGPISTPGLTALTAIANPAGGDYLYFVSGDDGKNYFAKTNSEHEENVRKYCQKLCFGL